MNTLLQFAALALVLIAGVRPALASSSVYAVESTTGVATPTPATTIVVVVDVLNLRAGPGTNHPILDRVTRNTRLEVTGRSQDGAWLAVQTGSRSGWVAARYVRPVHHPELPCKPSRQHPCQQPRQRHPDRARSSSGLTQSGR